MKPIKRILVGNRGEIAVRILKTAEKMGLETVAVFSEADRGAPHVQMADQAECIGPSPVDQSYLNPDKILQAAKIHQANAIHPGYGLLSEDADFAEACDAEGLIFIGPTPKQLREFGLKHRARALASETGVPLAPGSGLIRDLANAELEAGAIGYPVMLKGTAGAAELVWLCVQLQKNSRVISNGSDGWQSPILEMQEFFWRNFSPGPVTLKSKSLGMARGRHYPLGCVTARPNAGIKKFWKKLRPLG